MRHRRARFPRIKRMWLGALALASVSVMLVSCGRDCIFGRLLHSAILPPGDLPPPLHRQDLRHVQQVQEVGECSGPTGKDPYVRLHDGLSCSEVRYARNTSRNRSQRHFIQQLVVYQRLFTTAMGCADYTARFWGLFASTPLSHSSYRNLSSKHLEAGDDVRILVWDPVVDLPHLRRPSAHFYAKHLIYIFRFDRMFAAVHAVGYVGDAAAELTPVKLFAFAKILRSNYEAACPSPTASFLRKHFVDHIIRAHVFLADLFHSAASLSPDTWLVAGAAMHVQLLLMALVWYSRYRHNTLKATSRRLESDTPTLKKMSHVKGRPSQENITPMATAAPSAPVNSIVSTRTLDLLLSDLAPIPTPRHTSTPPASTASAASTTRRRPRARTLSPSPPSSPPRRTAASHPPAPASSPLVSDAQPRSSHSAAPVSDVHDTLALDPPTLSELGMPLPLSFAPARASDTALLTNDFQEHSSSLSSETNDATRPSATEATFPSTHDTSPASDQHESTRHAHPPSSSLPTTDQLLEITHETTASPLLQDPPSLLPADAEPTQPSATAEPVFSAPPQARTRRRHRSRTDAAALHEGTSSVREASTVQHPPAPPRPRSKSTRAVQAISEHSQGDADSDESHASLVTSAVAAAVAASFSSRNSHSWTGSGSPTTATTTHTTSASESSHNPPSSPSSTASPRVAPRTSRTSASASKTAPATTTTPKPTRTRTHSTAQVTSPSPGATPTGSNTRGSRRRAVTDGPALRDHDITTLRLAPSTNSDSNPAPAPAPASLSPALSAVTVAVDGSVNRRPSYSAAASAFLPVTASFAASATATAVAPITHHQQSSPAPLSSSPSIPSAPSPVPSTTSETSRGQRKASRGYAREHGDKDTGTLMLAPPSPTMHAPYATSYATQPWSPSLAGSTSPFAPSPFAHGYAVADQSPMRAMVLNPNAQPYIPGSPQPLLSSQMVSGSEIPKAMGPSGELLLPSLCLRDGVAFIPCIHPLTGEVVLVPASLFMTGRPPPAPSAFVPYDYPFGGGHSSFG
eukprot:m.29264 g.29264  ORF g.29264 m.29264 type:complete len:1031 (+) comp9146_c0_seq1:205-3297(+)